MLELGAKIEKEHLIGNACVDKAETPLSPTELTSVRLSVRQSSGDR